MHTHTAPKQAFVGRFPRVKVPSKPVFKGPLRFIKQTKWEGLSRQRIARAKAQHENSKQCRLLCYLQVL